MPHDETSRTDFAGLLVEEKVITAETLQELLKNSSKTHHSILELLIHHDKFDDRALVRVLSERFGYTAVNPSIFVLEPSLLKLVPKKLAEEHLILPITVYERTLTVAFANPMNLKMVDELRAITGYRIKTAVAPAGMLKTLISKYYRDGISLDSEFETHEEMDSLVKLIKEEKHSDMTREATANLMKVAHETPVIKLVNMLIIEGIRRRASDIFIEPWEEHVRVRARVDGLLEEIARPPKGLGDALVSRIKIMSELNIAEHRIPQDGRFKVKQNDREVDMRVSILPTSFGEKVCIRILDTKGQSHDLTKLGFTKAELQIVKDCAKHPHGMILVTGPTGSGKTTTLYSLLKYLDSPEVNITTVEDPVEYQLAGINQVHVRENIGLTFPAALRSILRQDPNIILIGEIRDRETMDIAIKAALTGHLVLSTLHTNDAASSITRMINMGLEPFLIASTVLMISAQRLVRRLCSRCRTPQTISEEVLKKLHLPAGKNSTFYIGKGCNECRQTGYKGRSVITEILQLKPEICEQVMRGASADEIKALAKKTGMTTLRESAVQKALEGETSLDEVFRVTSEDSHSGASRKGVEHEDDSAEDAA
ncbi:MAG: Flp pilus assembly complex ATPase component TadA [Candidatus Omnitrophica bacterium]|nr:Flp pilus assembly complex ATPase component TadA [Candidatus Omnitrophota bacterium]